MVRLAKWMVLATLFETEPEPAYTVGATMVETDLWTAELATPIGPMKAMATDQALVMLEFLDEARAENQTRSLMRFVSGTVHPARNTVIDFAAKELDRYFAGDTTTFSVPTRLFGSVFQEAVWNHLCKVGYGQTTTYLAVAEAVATKRATRAVGKANGDNRLAIVVPCHRVIRADGHMCGYGGGIWRKQFLLALESGQPLLL